jgi:hypothetical protein
MAHGEVWHSAMCRQQRDISLVFMHLVFAEREVIEELEAQGIVAFYEHMSERQARSVNGMPTFFSCHTLTREENVVVIAAYNEEAARLKALDVAVEKEEQGVDYRRRPHCHSQNSRAFRCACGERHTWPIGREQVVICTCGRIHSRNRGAHEDRRNKLGGCEGFGTG